MDWATVLKLREIASNLANAERKPLCIGYDKFADDP